jgi:hypothetical protein
MTTLNFHTTTTATPQQFLEALTDFGPGRSELFPNSLDAFLSVHAKGAYVADVTEGGRGTWERLRYDWSEPGRVVMTTTDSNVWGGRSGHTYTFTSLPDRSMRVDARVVRDGKNLKGWLLGLVLGTFGRRVLQRAFEETLHAVEARNGSLLTQQAA